MLNMISYDSITLVPRVISEVVSRDDVDTSVDMGSFTLNVPIIASPMPDVCGAESAFILRRCGSMGIIHRFQTVKGQLAEFHNANAVPETSSVLPDDSRAFPEIRNYDNRNPVACAIGINGDYLERFQILWTAGCRVFCLDTANGANKRVKTALIAIREEWRTYPDAQYFSPYIIAGNVATKEGYEFLAELGVDAVRVGMAGGSVCTTRNETGVFMPTLESVDECVQYRGVSSGNRYCGMPLIIADGGIRYPGDMAKAIAVGADVVMGGRIFAGYKESPGSIVKDRTSNGLYKLYRGAASHGVQKSTSGEQPDYNEGAEELVPYIDKSVASVVSRFRNGLRSTMSMMNATTISAFRDNVSIEDL